MIDLASAQQRADVRGKYHQRHNKAIWAALSSQVASDSNAAITTIEAAIKPIVFMRGLTVTLSATKPISFNPTQGRREIVSAYFNFDTPEEFSEKAL